MKLYFINPEPYKTVFISTKFSSKYNVAKTNPYTGVICIVHMEKTQNLVISKIIHFHHEILDFQAHMSKTYVFLFHCTEACKDRSP